jgi:hypothetical protein
VPSKVNSFAWQVLLDRVPTRDNLRRRGVVGVEGSSCPFCQEATETVSHLFLHCRITVAIWYSIYNWSGVVSVLPPYLPMSYAMFVGCGSNKQRRKGFLIIWLAYIWGIWKTRNNCVFNNGVVDRSEVVDLVQREAWGWFLHNTVKGSCLLYEWVWNPVDCMLC